jgi:hypothetical protein
MANCCRAVNRRGAKDIRVSADNDTMRNGSDFPRGVETAGIYIAEFLNRDG